MHTAQALPDLLNIRRANAPELPATSSKFDKYSEKIEAN